jgi:hypothetical protein
VIGTTSSTAVSATAQADLVTKFAALNAMACSNISSNLNGVVLTPGVYCVPAATSNLTTGMTLSGSGTYVFRMSSTLITGAGGAVNLTGGASCGQVHWAVGTSATLAGSFVGNVIADQSVTMTETTLTGRALAITAATTMTGSTINNSGCN